MKIIAILLIVLGIVGVLLGIRVLNDPIGIAPYTGALTALLCGIGFLKRK